MNGTAEQNAMETQATGDDGRETSSPDVTAIQPLQGGGDGGGGSTGEGPADPSGTPAVPVHAFPVVGEGEAGRGAVRDAGSEDYDEAPAPSLSSSSGLPGRRMRVVPRDPSLFERRPEPVEEEQDEELSQPRKPGRPGRPPKGGARSVRTFRDKLASAKPGNLLEVKALLEQELARAGLAQQEDEGPKPSGPAASTPVPAAIPPAASMPPGAPVAGTPAPGTQPAVPRVMGVPLPDVEAWAPLTRAFAGELATRWGFRGEHEPIEFFPGTPVAFKVGGNLERDLGQYSAAYLGQKFPLTPAGGGEVTPGRALAATCAGIVLPRALPMVAPAVQTAAQVGAQLVRKVAEKLRRTRSRRG